MWAYKLFLNYVNIIHNTAVRSMKSGRVFIKAIGRTTLRNFITFREFFGYSKNMSFNRNIMLDLKKIAKEVRSRKTGNLLKVRNPAAVGEQ